VRSNLWTSSLKSKLRYEDGKLYWLPKSGPGRTGRAGTLKKDQGYRRLRVGDGKYVSEHRLIWEMHNGPIPEGMQVDHINGIRDDNRIENLQLLTLVENATRRTVGYGESPYCKGRRKLNK